MDRHEVGEVYARLAGVEGGLEDIGVAPVAAVSVEFIGRREAQEAAFAGIQQPPEDGRGIEAAGAIPVDGAVLGD